MKRITSLLMALLLMFSLIPGNIVFAAAEDNTVITITPSVTSVQKSAGTASLYYTVSVTPKSSTAISAMGFTFVVPEGVTLATTKGASANATDKFWLNQNDLYYTDMVPGYENGKFSTFAYNGTTKHFSASGSNNGGLTETATLMTIGATIDLSKFNEGDTITLGLVDNLSSTVWSKVGDNTSYAPTVSSAAITIPKAPLTTADVSLSGINTGDAFASVAASTSSSAYDISTAWLQDGVAVSGANAGPVETYTAKVTLTAKTGESFDVNSFALSGWTVDKTNSTAAVLILTKDFETGKGSQTVDFKDTANFDSEYGAEEPNVPTANAVERSVSAEEGGALSFRYYTNSECTTPDGGSTTYPTAVGQYWVKAVAAGGTKYNAAESAAKAFEITKKTVSGAVTATMEVATSAMAANTDTQTIDLKSVIYKGLPEGFEIGTASLAADVSAEGQVVAPATASAGVTTVTTLAKKDLSKNATQTISVQLTDSKGIYADVTAAVTLSVVENYTVSVTLSGAPTSAKTFGDSSFELTASAIDINGKTLSGGWNWSSSNSSVATVNNGEVTIVGAGTATIRATYNHTNYAASYAEASITVDPADMAYTAPVKVDSLTYNGENQTLISAGSVTTANAGVMWYSTDNTNWSTDLPRAKDAGTYTVYYKVASDGNAASRNENYNAVSGSISATIGKKALSDDLIDTISGTLTYKGTAYEPIPTVYSVSVSEDCDITYQDNVDVGTATVTLTAKASGNFTGSASKTFAITAKEVTIAWSDTTLKYTGNAQKPTATVSNKCGSDDVAITVSGEQTDVGNYEATAAGLTGAKSGNYKLPETGLTQTFQITKADAPTGITGAMNVVVSASGKLALSSITYTGLDKDTVNPTAYKLAAATDGNIGSGDKDASELTLKSLTVDQTQEFSVVIESKNYEDITATVTLTVVNKTDLSSSIVTNSVINSSFTYDGEAVEFTKNATVTGHSELKDSLVYTFSGVSPTVYAASTTAPTNAGSYQLVVSIPGDNALYMGSQTINFTIGKADIIMTASMTDWTYGENASTPSVDGNSGSGDVTYTYKVKGADDDTYSENKPTNAGAYTMKAVVGETANYKGGSATVDFTISKADITVTASMTDWTYGENAGTPSVSGNSGSGSVTYYYKVKNAADNTYTITKPSNAGTYTMKAVVAETANYNGGNATVDFTIAKTTASCTAPTANTLTYTGEALALVSAGETSDGTMKYSTEQNGTYSTTIPTGTDAGNYTVWYKVEGDSNHNDNTATSVAVSIAKKDAPTDVAKTYTVYYMGGEQTVTPAVGDFELPSDCGDKSITAVAEGTDTNGIISVSGTTITVTPTGDNSDVGKTATANVTIQTKNYADITAVATIQLVDKQPATVLIEGFQAYSESTTYGCEPFTLTASVDGGLTGGTWSWSCSDTSVLSLSNTNSATVTVAINKASAKAVTLTATYENTTHKGSNTASITVDKGDIFYMSPDAKEELIYTGVAQALVTEGAVSTDGVGSMQYSLDGTDYSTEVPTAIDAGSYNVYWKVDGNDNYEGVNPEFPIQVSIAKADITVTASMTDWTYGESASNPSVSGNSGSGEVTYTYKVKNAADSTYTETKPTNAGEYTMKAVVAETTNYNGGSDTVDFTIAKAAGPAAPTATATDCTTDKQNNGKITGVNATMEYMLKSGTGVWTKITGEVTELTGLVPGTYQVRVAETDNVKAGTAAEVTIAAHECVFETYTPNNDATCQKNGTETAHCTGEGCTATDTREIPNSTTAHHYVDGVCEWCNAVNPVASTLSTEAVTSASDVATLVSAGTIKLADGVEAAKIFAAIENGTLTTKNEVKAIEKPASATDFTDKATEVVRTDSSVKSAEVVGYLDVSVALVASGTDLGNITKTDEAVTFQVKLDADTLAKLEGKLVFVLREHNGEITKLDATLKDGVLTFRSDAFSTYAIVAYEPMSGGGHYHGGTGTTVKSGDTFDAGILAYVGAAFSSACGAVYVLSKKTHKKGKREE